MQGGGEVYIDKVWDFLTFHIMMGLAILGASGFCLDGGVEVDGGGWG